MRVAVDLLFELADGDNKPFVTSYSFLVKLYVFFSS